MTSPISRALISVSDKHGIIDFARSLSQLGIEIISTGGTARLLSEQGIAVIDVSDYTGFPEMMDGRVKTLHPKIHGGILGRREKDNAVMRSHQIAPIDLVVVNLYPFQQTIAKANCTFDDAIENIDIGGPTMLRAAAKNFTDVTVLVDAEDYSRVLSELASNQGKTSQALRFGLATKAFEHTAAYDGNVANYLRASYMREYVAGDEQSAYSEAARETLFPRTVSSQYIKQQDLRYGENPHQQAAFYVKTDGSTEPSIANAVLLQGKDMSYNNIADTDAALECVKQFVGNHACVIVKHANPCGVAIAENQLLAYERAYRTDAESAFGGIIAFNSTLQAETAEKMIAQQFVEVIVAPKISVSAQQVLAQKQNLRVLEIGELDGKNNGEDNKINLTRNRDFKRVNGGLLIQEIDAALFEQLKVVTKRAPSDLEMEDLLFAWKVAKFVKSNAIIYASGQMTIGIGAGQMSRVNSARIAAIKAEHAGLEVNKAVMASDAFFPFRDGLDNAAAVGIKAVIQPGGAMRDDDVIAAADEHDMAMVYTGMRHFRH